MKKVKISAKIQEVGKGTIETIKSQQIDEKSLLNAQEIELDTYQTGWSFRKPLHDTFFADKTILPIQLENGLSSGYIYSDAYKNDSKWYVSDFVVDGRKMYFPPIMSSIGKNICYVPLSNNFSAVSYDGLTWFGLSIDVGYKRLDSIVYSAGYLYGVAYTANTLYLYKKKCSSYSVEELSGQWELVSTISSVDWGDYSYARIFSHNNLFIIYSNDGETYLSENYGVTFVTATAFSNLTSINIVDDLTLVVSASNIDSSVSYIALLKLRQNSNSNYYIYENVKKELSDINAISTDGTDLFVAHSNTFTIFREITYSDLNQQETIVVSGNPSFMSVTQKYGSGSTVLVSSHTHFDETALVRPAIYEIYITNPLEQDSLYITRTFYKRQEITYRDSVVSSEQMSEYSYRDTFNGLLFDTVSDYPKQNGAYKYTSSMFIKGNNITRLSIYFCKDSTTGDEIYPTKIIINQVEYENNSYIFNVDFYMPLNEINIIFNGLNAETSKLGISSILVGKSLIVSKGKGLKSLSIEGVKEDSPSYGLMSYSGDMTFIDYSNALSNQSDRNWLQKAKVNIYINNVPFKEFFANNDIAFNPTNGTIHFSLKDTVELLQTASLDMPIYLENVNCVDIFNALCNKFNHTVILSEDIINFAKNIIFDKIYIETDTWWNIWNSFAIGVKARFFKNIDGNYIIRS